MLTIEDVEKVRAAVRDLLAGATAERDRLLAAIRKHRDYRGDDRCFLDDAELYAALPEGAPPSELLCLDDPLEMLANCRRFIASRQPGGQPYVSPQREIERLKAENASLRAEVTTLRKAILEEDDHG